MEFSIFQIHSHHSKETLAEEIPRNANRVDVPTRATSQTNVIVACLVGLLMPYDFHSTTKTLRRIFSFDFFNELGQRSIV